MKIVKKKLKKKGWKEKEINKAINIIKLGEIKKPKKLKLLDSLIFWIMLFLTIIGNLVVSVVIVPVLLVMQGFYLYLVLFIIGATFGLLINSIVMEIENIQKKDVIKEGIFILALAVINVYIITVFSNKLETILELSTPLHSPVLVSVVYVAAFAMPHLLCSFKKRFLTRV